MNLIFVFTVGCCNG